MLCLQETKTAQLTDAATTALDRLGYAIEHVGANAYNGVAVASRHPIEDVVASGGCDDEHLDREPRLITCLVRTPAPVRVAAPSTRTRSRAPPT